MPRVRARGKPEMHSGGIGMIDPHAAAQAGPTGIREAARFLKRHKIIIFLPAILLAGIAWTIASRTPPRYEAAAALTLNVDKVQVVDRDREVVSRLPLESSFTLKSGRSTTGFLLTLMI